MKRSQLQNKEVLQNNQDVVSRNGRYHLRMQSDGNLVLYQKDRPLWASNTKGKGVGPFRLVVQSDNNLVVYDNNAKVVWANNVYIGNDGQHWDKQGFASLKDDGNFVVYDGANELMWETATNGGRQGIYGFGRKHQKKGFFI